MSDLHDLFETHGAIVLFDTETTGLDAKNCQIIELAALRVERNEQGEIGITERYDSFIKLPDGQTIPENITGITGITDDMLSDGISEEQAVSDFTRLTKSRNGYPTLLVAHNAQFDMLFLKETFARYGCDDLLLNPDVLDTLTVYKDRSPYPHKLSDAISEYGLDDKVQNSHRAIDDVLALHEICKALDEERPDLCTYVNVFGYNPKYGISGEKLPGIIYHEQPYTDSMQLPENTLPSRAYRRMRQSLQSDACKEQEKASAPKRHR